MSAAQLAHKPPPPSEPDKAQQKAILKRIVDPAGPYVRFLQNRCALHMQRGAPWLQPTSAGALQLLPPEAYPDCSASSLTCRFVATAHNRTRCAVNTVGWTPEGRRCMTGDNIGQLSLWNSQDFKFEQLYQAHDKGLRAVRFSHNGSFLFSGDDSGVLRIFKSNLAPLQRLEAHKEAVRSLGIAPSDVKFATASDDGSIKIWDLATCAAEKTFTGHGSDVRGVDWHPAASLLASCSRDGMVKLWDARMEPATALLATLHGHKGPVNQVRWNLNGSWLASVSRDQTVRVWDVRHTKRELVSWQGHTREVASLAWHPVHLELLASSGGDGCIIFWLVGQAAAAHKIEAAHESNVTGLAFHPVGHLLASCAMEACTKFWVRPRPGDPWKGSGLQRDQEDAAASYAELLSAAAAAAAGQAGGAAGAAGAAGTGTGLAAAPTTLPGGIAVKLPGLGGAAAGRGLPGVPRLPMPPPLAPHAPGLGQPPGFGAPPPFLGSGPPGMGMQQPAMPGMQLQQPGMPPGLQLPAAVPGLAAGLPPQLPGFMPPGLAGGGGGGAGSAPLLAAQQQPGQGVSQQHGGQQQRGFKRPREAADGGGGPPMQHAARAGPGRGGGLGGGWRGGFGGRGGPGAGPPAMGAGMMGRGRGYGRGYGHR